MILVRCPTIDGNEFVGLHVRGTLHDRLATTSHDLQSELDPKEVAFQKHSAAEQRSFSEFARLEASYKKGAVDTSERQLEAGSASTGHV